MSQCLGKKNIFLTLSKNSYVQCPHVIFYTFKNECALTQWPLFGSWTSLET